MIRCLITALSIFSGCASLPYEHGPDRQIVTVRVHWVSVAQVPTYCGPNALACARRANADSIQDIWVVKPTGFGDDNGVYLLGHEFLHALGATHK